MNVSVISCVAHDIADNSVKTLQFMAVLCLLRTVANSFHKTLPNMWRPFGLLWFRHKVSAISDPIKAGVGIFCDWSSSLGGYQDIDILSNS